jgi:hypothetical protein
VSAKPGRGAAWRTVEERIATARVAAVFFSALMPY